MSDWEFYVDESGDFEVPALQRHDEPRVVCGVLMPTGTRFKQAALRRELERAIPYWSWPFHSTEFRDPMAHLLRWHAADRPAVPGAERATTAMERMAAWLTKGTMQPDLAGSVRACITELKKEPESEKRVETPRGLRRQLSAVMEVLHGDDFETLQAYCLQSADLVMKVLGHFVSTSDGIAILSAPEDQMSEVIDRAMSAAPENGRMYLGCLWAAMWRAGLILAVDRGGVRHAVSLRALRRGTAQQSIQAFTATVTALYAAPRLRNLPLAGGVGLNVDHPEGFPAFDRSSALLLVYADWVANRMLTSFKPRSGSMRRVEHTARYYDIPLARSSAHSIVAVGALTGHELAARRDLPVDTIVNQWTAEPFSPTLPAWARDAHAAGLDLINPGGV